MRKTKKLNGLVATTFALALVLLGVVPGIEPLEAQAGIIVSTQISTDYILDFFNNNVVNDSIIIGEDTSISFSQDANLFIGGESTQYTSGSTWTNNTAQEYKISELSHDEGSTDNLTITLQPCSFSGDKKVQVRFDAAFKSTPDFNSAFTFDLGNSSTISKDDLIAGMQAKFPSNIIIEDNKLYKNTSLTDYYTDTVDVSSGKVYAYENTYDIILDTYIIARDISTNNTPVSSDSSTPTETKKEEPKPIEVPKTPETHFGTFQEDAINKVQAAITNINKATVNGSSNQSKGISLDTGIWVSFNRNVYEEIEKCDIPVTISFVYKNVRYTVTIPANAKVTSLVDKNGYCGFFNLGAHYGYDKIEEL